MANASMGSRIALADEHATNRLGADLALVLRPGDVVALSGEVGAGKSTLARSIIRTLLDDERAEVPSPTFTLVQPYEGETSRIIHADLYRLGDPSEAEELGLGELGEGIVLVEWPERGDLGDLATIRIALRETNDGASREAEIEAQGEVLERIKRSLIIREFLGRSGHAEASRGSMSADASTRCYELIVSQSDTLLLMDAPAMPDGPPVRDGLSYSRLAHLAEDVRPFVAVGEALRAHGFHAPALHGIDLDKGLLLMDHMGDGSILQTDGRPNAERYAAVVEVLAAIHERDWPVSLPIPRTSDAHIVPPFDRRAMMIETELTLDWAFPRLVGRPAAPEERDAFKTVWNEALDAITQAEKSLVLRDVQCTNVVWRESAQGHNRVGLIDYQDALMGPATYDLASLAQDARVTIDETLEAGLLAAYHAARSTAPDPLFEQAYAVMAAQRATKLFGLWVRLDERDGKPEYLANMPRTHEYLTRNFRHPALQGVRAWFEAHDLLDRSLSLAKAA